MPTALQLGDDLHYVNRSCIAMHRVQHGILCLIVKLGIWQMGYQFATRRPKITELFQLTLVTIKGIKFLTKRF